MKRAGKWLELRPVPVVPPALGKEPFLHKTKAPDVMALIKAYPQHL